MISKTFCSAAWFCVRLDWDGQYKPCCEIDISKSKFIGKKIYSIHDSNLDSWMTSEYLKYIKQSLDQDQKISECHRCWQKEESGALSLRQTENRTVVNNQDSLNNTWVGSFFKHKDYSKFYLRSADIKLSNVCNFTCAMCSPENSSKLHSQWKSQKDSEFVVNYLNKNKNYFEIISQNYESKENYKHLVDILQQPIKNLKLLGGEPLLDKQMFNILESLDKQKQSKIHLHFVTNGSQDLVKTFDRLKNFRSVSYSISLEGIEETQDFVRTGSNWSVVEKNILAAKSAGIPIDIHYTIQALSIFNVQKLLSWCQLHSLNLVFGILNNPDYLAFSVLPMPLRQLAIERIQDSSLISILGKQPYHPENYDKFLRFVEWHEKNSDFKFRDTLNFDIDNYVITKSES